MRKMLVPALVLSSALSACGTPAPVELPEDPIAAASTCFAAQGLLGREGKSEDDPISYEEFASAISYAMAAAGQAESFDPEVVTQVINGAGPVAEEIAGQDYEGAIPACNARFGIDDTVELPEENADALLSCLAFSGFMQGVVQAQGEEDMGAQVSQITSLVDRLTVQMESDPEVLVMMLGGDTEELMFSGLQGAFAEGAPDAYVAACEARFPA